MTTTVKAKCPGCGDEEGLDAKSLTAALVDNLIVSADWRCSVCRETYKVPEWIKPPRTLTDADADVEAIASRVVELMKEKL